VTLVKGSTQVLKREGSICVSMSLSVDLTPVAVECVGAAAPLYLADYHCRSRVIVAAAGDAFRD